ncbi:MAG: serine/threonine protein kinase, partial [Hyphomonas sp.]|nr:serine/threonine protein kinase [Hyphomonas sp.]
MTGVEFERRVLALVDAALDLPAGERADFVSQEAAGDDTLARRVMVLLDQEEEGSDSVLRTGGAADALGEDAMPERAGPYRFVNLIGRGGMGAVFEGARDTGDFDHKVAIKVIRTAALDGELVDRFHRERQILARLNHPNIARLLDGGALDDGSPYIVMEFVDGEPITDWVGARGLDLVDRLWLFNDVCAAVRHAHQSLVIHRDITPSNVLVTKTGVVKLIDFGIARPDDGARPTPGDVRTESRSYTPGYAAPERLTGAGATVLSDVFSLGRLLDELTQAVERGPELTAIIARATAAEPDERYVSVDALMGDVLAFLQKRPVRAMNGGQGYAARKYVQRHPRAVIAAGLVFASLVGGLVLTTSLYRQAEAQRLAADKRYGEVRELAKFMMFDLYDELQKVTGNTQATEMIANKSLTYLESLRSDPRAPMEVALETAAGYQRLADVLGNPTAPNLGERATATVMLDNAIESLEDLYRRYPDNREVMEQLAAAAFSGATNAYVSDDDADKARALAQRSGEIWSRLAARPDATVDDRRNVLRARLMAAVPLPWIGRGADGVAELKSVAKDAAALQQAYPDNTDVEQFVGSVNVELARAVIRARDQGQGDESALPYWNTAAAVREAAYARNPKDMRPYRALATIYYERGAEYRTQEQFDEALADMRRASAIIGELQKRDPDDMGLSRTASGIREETAKTLAYAGRGREAAAMIPDLEREADQEHEAFAGNAGIAREYAYSLTLYADIYSNAGMDAERCAMVARAKQAWANADAAKPLSDLDHQYIGEYLPR